MPCYGALTGYYSSRLNVSGRRSIVFDKRQSLTGVPILIPCGKCIGCRLTWRRQWAIRCMHEKRLHAASAFATLTYDDDHLPSPPSLSLSDLQLFMKRLRATRPAGLRFFACGEYGETTWRPHYHLLLFNTDFPDMRYWKDSASGDPLFRSAELSRLWPSGSNVIGSVTAKSAAYVAGYLTKKVGPAPALPVGFAPEFRVMSRRPGIGRLWLERFGPEAYRHDSVILDHHEVALPKYYDAVQAVVSTVVVDGRLRSPFDVHKSERRREGMLFNPEDRTKARMMTRELFELRKSQLFSREEE
ncbi:replication initiator protein [Blackfly microvirus SF02]|uniref:Replication initiator protein n=1 Tax=Blackfly microvirus SF02 TaxID=2576452 RepID=A0A4V1F5E4_9VIRU|nr:replication initiator protein [Blackfly microvirus SF02]